MVVGVLGVAEAARPTGGGSIVWMLRMPLLGAIAQKFSTSQVARTLATLLGGGIPLVNAHRRVGAVDRQPAHGARAADGGAAGARGRCAGDAR